MALFRYSLKLNLLVTVNLLQSSPGAHWAQPYFTEPCLINRLKIFKRFLALIPAPIKGAEAVLLNQLRNHQIA